MPGKTVLLTGANGFVGRQVRKALLARGHSVRRVVRRGQIEQTQMPPGELDPVETDDLFAEDRDWWAQRLEGVDCLIHAAWYVEPGHYQDARENIACALSALAMAEGAVAAGTRHVIGIGTCMEYRLPSKVLSVAAPLGPSTLYAASKLATFFMLGRHFANTGSAFTWARLFYLYGEGEHPARLVPYIRRQLANGAVADLSAGTQLRDYLDVTEAGSMIARLTDTGQSGPVNICSGNAITIRALAERVAGEYGRLDLLHFGSAKPHPSDPEAVVGISNLWPEPDDG